MTCQGFIPIFGQEISKLELACPGFNLVYTPVCNKINNCGNWLQSLFIQPKPILANPNSIIEADVATKSCNLGSAFLLYDPKSLTYFAFYLFQNTIYALISYPDCKYEKYNRKYEKYELFKTASKPLLRKEYERWKKTCLKSKTLNSYALYWAWQNYCERNNIHRYNFYTYAIFQASTYLDKCADVIKIKYPEHEVTFEYKKWATQGDDFEDWYKYCLWRREYYRIKRNSYAKKVTTTYHPVAKINRCSRLGFKFCNSCIDWYVDGYQVYTYPLKCVFSHLYLGIGLGAGYSTCPELVLRIASIISYCLPESKCLPDKLCTSTSVDCTSNCSSNDEKCTPKEEAKLCYIPKSCQEKEECHNSTEDRELWDNAITSYIDPTSSKNGSCICSTT